jgi:2-dehydropantoate 2-reductase
MTNHWHVLGAGAIGSLFATSLHRAGLSTTLLRRAGGSRPGSLPVCIDTGERTETTPLPVSYNDEPSAVSHLLLTTKAYDVLAAVADVAHRLSARSHIVILVNGMGIMEELKARYPAFQFTAGTTTEGVYPVHNGETPHHFCHAGHGITRLGQAALTRPPPWFGDWEKLDLASSWTGNIEESLWQKLAINCAINPLCAAHGCKNGALATRPELAGQVTALCDEIARVSAAAGFSDAASNIHRWVDQVIDKTRENRCSMLQDILARRRTENDYISGYLLKRARQFGVAVPRNTAVYDRVMRLDNSNS